MSIMDHASALHDREERRALALDDLPPIDCCGILWLSQGGEATTDGAEWSPCWEEITTEALHLHWTHAGKVFAALGAMKQKPRRGDEVPAEFAAVVLDLFREDIDTLLQERAA